MLHEVNMPLGRHNIEQLWANINSIDIKATPIQPPFRNIVKNMDYFSISVLLTSHQNMCEVDTYRNI